MGRLSALVLQAVCFLFFCWLAHREASRCIWNCSQCTTEKRSLSETASHRVLTAMGPFTVPVAWTRYQSWKKRKIRHFWSRNWLVHRAKKKKKKARPLPISVTLTSMVNRGHPKQQEHSLEHETIHIQLCSGVGGRLPFSITGDTWKTPCSVALTALMNPVASLCGKVRVERHHVLLSFLLQWVVRTDCATAGRTYICAMCICVWR